MRRTLMQNPAQSRQADVEKAVQDAQRAAQQATKDAMTAVEDAKTAVRDARTAAQDAKTAAQDSKTAAQDAAAPPPAQAPEAPGTIVFPGDGGNNIRLSVDGKGIKVCQEESCTTIPIQDVVPRGAVLMTYAVFGSLAFMVVGYPIARAFARWLDRRGQSVGPSRELQARLDAMERNIDAAAMEIERVGEGQRFTNRLLEQRPVEHAQRSDR